VLEEGGRKKQDKREDKISSKETQESSHKNTPFGTNNTNRVIIKGVLSIS